MSGTVIENLSGRKLSVLVAALLVCQVACFLVGGLIAPVPAGAQSILGTVCVDDGEPNDTTRWFYNRGEGACRGVELSTLVSDRPKFADRLVFVFQMPVPKEDTVLDYSRWQQNLIGVLHFDVRYHSQTEMRPRVPIALDARLAYRNRGERDGDWKLYAKSVERRNLDCTVEAKSESLLYNCSAIPLFELGSLHHDYYLLNVRLPVDSANDANMRVGHLNDMWLIAINQNGGFTKVWLSLKTVFFPLIVSAMVWFWRRVHLLARKPVVLEQMLMYLGGAMCVLNLPLEYLTLMFDMPFMLLLSDIRQGLFYAMLLSFWLIFAGEHMLVHTTPNTSTIKVYWRHLSAVVTGCVSLFVFDMCERGVQLRNPFYSIWVTDIGTNLALTFIILAGISAGIYFLFLCRMVWKVFCNISQKRASLPAMCSVRRLHYEGIIYRFMFMMLTTLVCAALTVIGFILGQVAEGQWKWDDNIQIEFTSAFFTGVYGMWNLYIFALLSLYAPSHKKWEISSNSDNQNLSEEIELSRLPSETSPTEISSLTSFIRKATID